MQRQIKKVLSILSITVLVCLGTAPALAGSDGNLQVAACDIAGNTVRVAVVNTGSQAKSGQVVVVAKVNGQLVRTSATLNVDGGEVEQVTPTFPGLVEEITSVSVIVDGPQPI